MLGFIIGMIITISRLSSAAQLQAPRSVTPDGTKEAVRVNTCLTECIVTEKSFRVRYQIHNQSSHDIWICESMNVDNPWADCEVYMDEDSNTLLVRRCLDAPMVVSRAQPMGRYVRVGSGEIRSEVMSFSLPLHYRVVLFGLGWQQRSEHAKRLVLEIGYYDEDLPAMVFRICDEERRSLPKEPRGIPAYQAGLTGMIGGALNFTLRNEAVHARDEEVLIPWTDGALKGERLVRMVVEGLFIPYSSQQAEAEPPRLPSCQRMDVVFKGSPLEFFYPRHQQQELLNQREKDFLRAMRDFTISEPAALMRVAYDISEGVGTTLFTERSVMELDCYLKDGNKVPLMLCEGEFLVTREGQVFRYSDGVPELRGLSPRVKSFDARIACASKLENVWYRFRLYGIAQHATADLTEFWDIYESSGQPVTADASEKDDNGGLYPPAEDWCDALLRGYRVAANDNETALAEEYECPSAGEGRCHYAMNPYCVFDSPSDMVLLFETKAGWNQHGGSERFTFDNHDPRGGLVLLNDGTVKFIRTEEELKQLRWK